MRRGTWVACGLRKFRRWHALASGAGPRLKTKFNFEDGPSLADFIAEAGQQEHASGPPNTPGVAPYTDPGLWRRGGKVRLETYGCQMNSADTEVVTALLQDAGYGLVDSPEAADVVLLNTCSVRDNAEQRVHRRLSDLRRRFPAVRLGVLGCMAERLKENLLGSNAGVSLVAGPDAYRDLPRLLELSAAGESAVNVQLSYEETYAEVHPVRRDPDAISAFVSIMRGCNNMCSYCIVPFTRGRERSRPADSIVEEARRLHREGVREVTLLGQNVNSYWDRRGDGSGAGYETAAGFTNVFKS
eukprot:Hpha_TRINITY_DN35493_c0_g1::TRINITY_DN35493_c0_g1_i1::g.83435::m.83435